MLNTFIKKSIHLKKKIILSSLLLIAITLVYPSLISTVFAHDHPGYSHDSTIGYQNPNWMGDIKDNARLSDLSIPGTHDSMALYGGDITQTQTMSLSTQLNSGVRFFDIRARHIENSFAIHHGSVFQNAFFGKDVVEEMIQFLNNNPNETILMRLKEEHTPSNNSRSFEDTFKWYKEIYSPYFWDMTHYNPTLGEVRGKIVVLQDFPSEGWHGIPYHWLTIQDNYNLSSNWELYNKWTAVKNHLFEANTSYQNGGDDIYLNYLSGSSSSMIVLPYFVASGHSSPGTSASRLSTGLTTPAYEDSYPDFPRLGCGGNVCTIAFEGTNILTTDLIAGSNFSYSGIVASDFPGKGLIANTINLNNHLLKEPRVQDGTYTIISALNDTSVVDMNQADNNVILWSDNGGNNQKWELEYNSIRSAYQIKSRTNENLVLAWNDYEGSNNVFATPNQQYEEHYWILEDAGNGHYYVRNKKDLNKVLDVSGGNSANGTNVTVYNFHGGNNQKFKLSNITRNLTGQIDSLYGPQPGQSSRSSDNFSLDHLAAGTKVQVVLEGEGAASLSFNVSRDIRNGSDRGIWSNVRDGSILTIPSGDDRKNLYISGPPSGYTSNGTFKVKFYVLP
nr:phosphatidylinositol-specific phospholipase C domain-containing protein [Bacillus thuringiensis]